MANLIEKSMIKSLENIIKELDKLEATENFAGVYYDASAFNTLYTTFLDVITTIKEDTI